MDRLPLVLTIVLFSMLTTMVSLHAAFTTHGDAQVANPFEKQNLMKWNFLLDRFRKRGDLGAFAPNRWSFGPNRNRLSNWASLFGSLPNVKRHMMGAEPEGFEYYNPFGSYYQNWKNQFGSKRNQN